MACIREILDWDEPLAFTFAVTTRAQENWEIDLGKTGKCMF